MKKIVILLGLVTSFCLFAGCASKATTSESVASPQPVVQHQDYKGEVGTK